MTLPEEAIVGAWPLVSATSETDDDTRGEPFSSSPKGVMIFPSDSHFSLFQSRAEIARIAANDRAEVTQPDLRSKQ